MAYEFETENTATFKFTKSTMTQSTLTLAGINSSVSSAQTIVNGIQRMLWITDQVGSYEPTDGTRTVKQDVIDNS